MARKRMIDPSIWINEDFGALSNLAKLVFIGLFSIADDEGRGKASPAYIKAVLFPYNDDLRIADIEKTLSEISSKMSVIFYSCDENMYYTLTSWNMWQKIDKPSQSKLPEYNPETMIALFDEHSTNTRRVFSPNKKRIEENIYTSKKILMEHFSLTWKKYPNKKGRAKALEYYLQWIKGRTISGEKIKLTDKQIYYAVCKYAKECEDVEQQFIKHGDTFFNKAILDYVRFNDDEQI